MRNNSETNPPFLIFAGLSSIIYQVWRMPLLLLLRRKSTATTCGNLTQSFVCSYMASSPTCGIIPSPGVSATTASLIAPCGVSGTGQFGRGMPPREAFRLLTTLGCIDDGLEERAALKCIFSSSSSEKHISTDVILYIYNGG